MKLTIDFLYLLYIKPVVKYLCQIIVFETLHACLFSKLHNTGSCIVTVRNMNCYNKYYCLAIPTMRSGYKCCIAIIKTRCINSCSINTLYGFSRFQFALVMESVVCHHKVQTALLQMYNSIY